MVALASAGPLDVLLTADAESDALARLYLKAYVSEDVFSAKALGELCADGECHTP